MKTVTNARHCMLLQTPGMSMHMQHCTELQCAVSMQSPQWCWYHCMLLVKYTPHPLMQETNMEKKQEHANLGEHDSAG